MHGMKNLVMVAIVQNPTLNHKKVARMSEMSEHKLTICFVRHLAVGFPANLWKA